MKHTRDDIRILTSLSSIDHECPSTGVWVVAIVVAIVVDIVGISVVVDRRVISIVVVVATVSQSWTVLLEVPLPSTLVASSLISIIVRGSGDPTILGCVTVLFAISIVDHALTIVVKATLVAKRF